MSAPPAAVARLPWLAMAFLAGYAALFVGYCVADDAPLPWDEAYLTQVPAAVAQAWHQDGPLAAAGTFWTTRCMKPPLSILGTLPGAVALGTGPVALRLDNLVIALAAFAAVAALLRRHTSRPWAHLFALGILVSPYALGFARMELAELYLWAVLALLLRVVTAADPFATRRRALVVGAVCGLGMMAKLSFPLLAAGPLGWALWRAGRAARQQGRLRTLAGNLLWAGAATVVTAAPFMAHNWKWMWRHLRAQYDWVGEEYRLGQPLDPAYLMRYLAELAEWVGQVWILLAGLAVVLTLAARLGRRRSTLSLETDAAVPPPGLPAAPLWALLLVDLTYCYLVHPVPDYRFLLGSMLAFQLLVASRLGRALDRRSAPVWLARAAMVLPLAMLLANSFVPGRTQPVLDLPALGLRAPTPAPAPRTAPDLRDAILDRLPRRADGPATLAMAGDHPHLNVDNLRLAAMARRQPVRLLQAGYAAPTVTAEERLAQAAADLWLVVHPGPAPGQPFPARWAEPIAALLAQDAAFERLPWQGTLPDGAVARLHRRR